MRPTLRRLEHDTIVKRAITGTLTIAPARLTAVLVPPPPAVKRLPIWQKRPITPTAQYDRLSFVCLNHLLRVKHRFPPRANFCRPFHAALHIVFCPENVTDCVSRLLANRHNAHRLNHENHWVLFSVDQFSTSLWIFISIYIVHQHLHLALVKSWSQV